MYVYLYIYMCVNIYICVCTYIYMCIYIWGYPSAVLDWPWGLQEVEVLRISRQSAHKRGKVIHSTDRLYPRESTHFCCRLCRLHGCSSPKSSNQCKFSKTPSGFEPAYSAVLQPAALYMYVSKYVYMYFPVSKYGKTPCLQLQGTLISKNFLLQS
jgi:hypothetical protein